MKDKMLFQIVDDIKQQMIEYLMSNMDRMACELVYGAAVVEVYIHEVPSQYEITDVQVIITHDIEEHKSPLLEAAIIKAMPDWFKMKHELEETGWLMSA